MEKFSSHSGRLNYAYHQASDADRTLVLLHGLGASHDQFSTMVSLAGVDLAGSSTSVLLIDLPGHGQNFAQASDQIDFDTFCSLVLGLCDALDIKAAAFGGISMGAALALMCAARCPDMVEKLYVIRPSWLWSAAPAHLSIIDRCGQWLGQASVTEALACLNADSEYREISAEVPRAAASISGLFERDNASAHARVLSAMFNNAPFSKLAELQAIKTPAVVIGTNADPLHPVAVANATANALHSAELKILPPRYLQPDKHLDALCDLILTEKGIAS